MFRFKQFSVDQSECAMKINTDGVLLGAIANVNKPATVLDIGTGTGVIALMLAQKYIAAKIDAIEIDLTAAETAGKNFFTSPFYSRLTIYPLSFEDYFAQHPQTKYDLIISNPPFYIGSLNSPAFKKTLAKHADINFFEKLMANVSKHLTPDGSCWIILPVLLSEIVIRLAAEQFLFLQRSVSVYSFAWSEPHRLILSFNRHKANADHMDCVIYKDKGMYADGYKKLLQPYFLAF